MWEHGTQVEQDCINLSILFSSSPNTVYYGYKFRISTLYKSTMPNPQCCHKEK